MSWVSLAVPVLVVLLVIGLLGLLPAFALRVKGFTLAIVAIPAGLAVIAVAAIISPWFSLRWSLIPPLALSLGLAAVLLILRKQIGVPRRATSRPHRIWFPLGAAAIGGAIIASSLVKGMQFGDAIPQTYDVSFHFNAVRYFLDAGTASPLDLDLASPGRATFYPALWHALVTLTVQLTGATIPVAANAVLFIVCAVVWPIGAVAFGRAIAGPSRLTTLISGIIAVAFPSFPLLFAGYGILYPNLLSFALLPYALVAVLHLLALGPARRSDPLTPTARWLLLLGTSGAAILAHPNALHVGLLWAVFPVLAALRRVLRGRPSMDGTGTLIPRQASTSKRALAVLSAIAFAASIPAAWYFGRTSPAPWEGRRTLLGAMFDAAGSTPHIEAHAWPVSLLILCGLIVVWRNPSLRWTVGSAAILCAVFIFSYGFPASTIRSLLLSPWYGDPLRLAALITFGALPLALLGARALLSLCLTQIRRFRKSRQRHDPGLQSHLMAAFGLAFLLAATQGAGALAGVQYIRDAYAFNEKSGLLSPDELKLIERLDTHVPTGERLVNNPWNGGALAYALAGYEVLVPHLGGNYDPRYTELTEEMQWGTPRACEIAQEINVNYILDFGERFLYDWPRSEPFEGISGIKNSPILTEMDREGDAALFKVTGCG